MFFPIHIWSLRRKNQAAFVQKIIDQKGQLIVEHEHSSCASGDGCQSSDDRCTNETTRVAKAVAQILTKKKVFTESTPEHVHVAVGSKNIIDPGDAVRTPVPQSDATASAAATAAHWIESESYFWTQERLEMLVKVTVTIIYCPRLTCL